MTVQINCAIVIATLTDWLKNLVPVFFNQYGAKPKPIAPCTRDFSHALRKLRVITRISDWFIALFSTVVIDFSTVI